MKDILTPEEIELILCWADFDMKVTPVAQTLHFCRKTIWEKITRIFQKTGYNPREFWDLHEIIKELERDDADGEQK